MLQSNTKSANLTIKAAEALGEQTETAPDTLQEKDSELNTPSHMERDPNDGLQVETPDLIDTHNKERSKNNIGINTLSGLHVETDDSNKKESANKRENGLQVETQDKYITNSEKPRGTNHSGLTVETKDKQDDRKNQITEAAVGLIMLRQEGNDSLFDKYDNSELLPVDVARQTDFGQDPNVENSALSTKDSEQQTEGDLAPTKNDDNNPTMDNVTVDNVNYDSDDTILLEKEITDIIGDGPILREDTPPASQDGLPVETATGNETQRITDQLADLTVRAHPRATTSSKRDALPVEMMNTPVSPNKGKVIIRSYKLRQTIPSDTEPTRNEVPEQNNTENEVLYPKVPTDNAT